VRIYVDMGHFGIVNFSVKVNATILAAKHSYRVEPHSKKKSLWAVQKQLGLRPIHFAL
jgi:hypothetical protein